MNLKKIVLLTKQKQWLTILLLLLLLSQVIVIGFFNLTQLKYHMGYDASCYYLKAMEMAKQGTIFIDNWVDQTTLYLDTSVPIAALIYSFFDDIFFSFGLANFLVDLALLFVLYRICGLLNLSEKAKLICLNIAVCPYLAPNFENVNNVGYYCSLLSEGQWYGVKTLIVLMLVKLVLELEQEKYNYFDIIVSEILLFIAGMSSGTFMLVTVIAPLILYYFVKAFYKNSPREIFSVKLSLLIIGAGLVLAGKIIQGHILGFASRESSMTLIGQDDFWNNLGSVLMGFVKLLSGLHSDSTQSALEIKGIIYLSGLAILLLVLVCTAIGLFKLFKNFEAESMYSVGICVILFNLVMFSVLDTRYEGASCFPERYLIPIFLLMLPCVGAYIDSLHEWKFYQCSLLLLTAGILLTLNVYSDVQYYSNRNNYEVMKNISDTMEELDVPVVYVYDINVKLESRNMRVVDKNRIYKFILDGCYNATVHWGDYTYYDDVAQVQGRNALLTTKEHFDTLPEYIKKQYTFYSQIDRFAIYYADVNKFDLVSGVSGENSVDFPTSIGIDFFSGELDENGSLISDGTAGKVLSGPFTSIPAGKYDFTVNYEVINPGVDGKTADFVISVNSENDVLGMMELNPEKQSVTLEDLEIKENSLGFGYQIFNHEGSIIRIDSFQITVRE